MNAFHLFHLKKISKALEILSSTNSKTKEKKRNGVSYT